jgi:hypothetical protein
MVVGLVFLIFALLHLQPGILDSTQKKQSEEESKQNNVEDTQEGFRSQAYCSKKPDLPGYVSNHDTGICADVVGRGTPSDYCRVVSRVGNDGHILDRFIACDINSKGGFSYWFRSASEEEGVKIGELPYVARIGNDRFDSYCQIVPPDGKNAARIVCYPVSGLGFSSGGQPDPNPPEKARIRLRTYENLVMWYPLVFPSSQNTIGFDTDVISQLKGTPKRLTIEPPYESTIIDNSKRQIGVSMAGGIPRLYSLQPFPMNVVNAISLMVKPTTTTNIGASKKRGSSEIIFFAGDDAYLNEVAVYMTNESKVGLRIFEGKAQAYRAERGRLKRGKWSHILIQYYNGNWEFYINGRMSGKSRGSRHSFVKRASGRIGTSMPGHRDESFTGDIADVRLYSRSLDSVGIRAILSDFRKNQLKI